jgi:hypothetical protein
LVNFPSVPARTLGMVNFPSVPARTLGMVNFPSVPARTVPARTLSPPEPHIPSEIRTALQ